MHRWKIRNNGFETTTKISGSEFVILKKDLVYEEHCNFMLDVHVEELDLRVFPPERVLEETSLS